MGLGRKRAKGLRDAGGWFQSRHGDEGYSMGKMVSNVEMNMWGKGGVLDLVA